MKIPAARISAVLLLGVNLPAGATSDDAERAPAVAAAIARADENGGAIERALDAVACEQRSSMEWLVGHMPDADLRRLDAEFLLAHVDGAFRAWHDAPWHALVDEELFRDAILPYASVSERRELWLPTLREKCLPMVADAQTPAEAAIALNRRIFREWNVRYSTSRARADQSVSESIDSGMATCTGLSIMLVNACRSVGLPARFVGVPLWTDGSGNHSWVEVWDGERWRFTGAAEPTGDRLDEAWFVGRASGQGGGDPRHAIYAITWRLAGVPFPMVFDPSRPRSRAIDVTDRYAGRAPKVPDDAIVLRVVVRDLETGERVARTVEVLDGDGAVIARGRTKDERFDLNDHLELVVPRPDAAGRVAPRFRVDGVPVGDVTVVRSTERSVEFSIVAPAAD